jgi:hypothetical protein
MHYTNYCDYGETASLHRCISSSTLFFNNQSSADATCLRGYAELPPSRLRHSGLSLPPPSCSTSRSSLSCCPGALCRSPAHIEVVVKLMQGASLCCSSRRSWGHCATRRDMCCPESRLMQLCHSSAATARRAASRYRHCRCPPTMT